MGPVTRISAEVSRFRATKMAWDHQILCDASRPGETTHPSSTVSRQSPCPPSPSPAVPQPYMDQCSPSGALPLSHLPLSQSSDTGLGRRSQGLFRWVLYHLTGIQTSQGENPARPKPYIRQHSLYLVSGIWEVAIKTLAHCLQCRIFLLDSGVVCSLQGQRHRPFTAHMQPF